METPPETEQVPLAEVAHGDVVQDPKSGKWITVARIVDEKISVQDAVDGDATSRYVAFYGDERLDEQIVPDDPDGVITRQVR
ncbi:hypothetical protein BH09ACT7_BH09ACT7_01870 [soil metagenome]